MASRDSVVAIQCLRYKHRGVISDDALARFGWKPGAPITSFVKRLRCIKCGSDASIVGAWCLRKYCLSSMNVCHSTRSRGPYQTDPKTPLRSLQRSRLSRAAPSAASLGIISVGSLGRLTLAQSFGAVERTNSKGIRFGVTLVPRAD